MGACSNPQTTISFLTPTVTVTITAGQKIFVMAHAALGAGVSPASNLNIYPGYMVQGTTTVLPVGGGIFGLTAPANSRQIYSISGVLPPLTAGTYHVGMAGSSSNAANWINSEWAYVTVLVLNP
ncbi:MAG: hypothetical protein HUU18_12875 [Phycisphaerales bacterium]|nr:hypothetical protein [Phycisphaerales bacterium]